ncbi:unnamed protein product [Ceutorhynchus assimilis]|uniref:DUF4485 domain-containing protein n=1 Tax=Ceutorhynchus assimilis TaxID=467358 RepID=A0A9N9MLW5_9CUCU|nr:unnamed protein product [Ceutorhynchus assimilis]
MEELVKNEFQFYATIAKPLVLNLPKSKDRILAAGWIRKFGQEAVGTEKLRTSYLKLLLFCLQRRRLTGIFSDNPSSYEFLEDLPEEIDLNEFARNLLEQEANERKATIRKEMMGDMKNFPAYTTDCSPDLTEYVACQDIPNFGVHAYYAISKQPVNKWQRAEKAILPKGTKSSIDTSITAPPAGVTSICVCTPKGTASAPQVEEGAAVADCLQPQDKTPSPDQKRRRRPQKFGTSPPTHPIGEVRRSTEDRPTPTWGTNLLEVRETTDIGHIEEPSDTAKALDKEVSKLIQDEEDAESVTEEAQETVASKAKDMLDTVSEFSRGKMKKRPKSAIKAPKSLKQPKIPVKGMKKKGPKKGGLGPRPANIPEEYADWTEKELEDAGLTWQDLLPIEENIDHELQRIEDEEMMPGLEEDLPIEEIAYTPYADLDLEAMIREAEADLAATVYETGVEADENAVELLVDEMYDIQDELYESAASEEARAASPAIASGIPVTTPQRSPSPRRMKSPETAFDGEDDALLRHRASPLRAPRPSSSGKKSKTKSPQRRSPSPRTDKDPNISRVYEQVERVGMDDSFEQHEREFQEMEDREREDSFEAHEREFREMEEREKFGQGTALPHRSPSPARAVSFSPGDADRARQRAWEQEQLLRTPQQQMVESPPRQMMRTPDRVMDQFDLGGMSPFMPAESPPHMTQQEQHDMMMYFAFPGEDSSLGLLPASVLESSGGDDSSLGLLPASVLQSPPGERVPEHERFPPVLFGSPIANQIIGEASNIFTEDHLFDATQIGENLDDVTPPGGDLSFMSASPGQSYHTADESLGLISTSGMSDDLVLGGDVEADRAIFDNFRPLPIPRRPPNRRPRPPWLRPRTPSPGPSPIRDSPSPPRGVPTPPPMPFFPGISAPITPIRQRPIPRPGWYDTPRPRIQTPQKQYGPEKRPLHYYTPEPPLVDPFDPLAYPDQGLIEHEEIPEAFGDLLESPRDERALTPTRRRPPAPLQVTPISRPGQALRQTQLFGTPCRPCSPSRSPAELEEFEQMERDLQAGSPGRQADEPILTMEDVSAQEAAARIQEMARQQDSLLRTVTPPRPPWSPSPVLDRRKVVSPPPRPPPYVPPQPPLQLWTTPEGVAGPSRRRTGFTPPVCPSDYTPSPSPVRSPRFQPARRIVKRGKRPPSPTTPKGDRYVPSPYGEPAQRLPPCGTPGRGDPLMIPRRLFDTPGRIPTMPAEESPIRYSPSPVCSPMHRFDFPPTLDAESPPLDMPPTPPPLLQEGQLYFPREVLPTATPEQLPTWDEIKQHQVVPDHLHAQISQRTPFGRGPGRYIHRESVRAFQPMDRIPEYADNIAHMRDRTFEDRHPYPRFSDQPVRVKVPKYYEPLPRDYPSPRPQSPIEYRPYTDNIRDILAMSPPQHPATYYPDVEQSAQDFMSALERYDLPCEPCTGGVPVRQPPPSGIRPPSGGLLRPSGIRPPSGLPIRPSGIRPPSGLPIRPSGIRPPSGTPLRPSGIRPPSGTPLRPSGLRPPATGPESLIRPPPGTPQQQALPQYGPEWATPDETGRASVPQAAPVKTAPTRSVAEPGRPSKLFKKIQLKETKSTMLRKKALADQKAAELEVQKKKEKAEQAKKKRKKKLQDERLREIVAQQTQEAGPAARDTPDPELMDLLQQHEVAFPGMRRSIVVQGRWKRLPRRSETGFEQMDRLQEEMGSPCEPCSGGDAYRDTIRDLRLFDRPQPQMRPQIQLTQQQQARMRFDEIEQNVIAREREEAEYFERMQEQQRLDEIEQNVISREREEAEYFQQPRQITEEEELAEFEALEREFLEQEAPPRPCPAAAPRQMTEEEELAEFEALERELLEQEEAPPQPAPRQMTEEEELAEFEALERELLEQGEAPPRPCPAAARSPPRMGPVGPVDRLTYSPPRPQSVFGLPPFQFPAQHLPRPYAPCTPSPGGILDAVTPPMYESPPPGFGLEMISPPPFFDVDFGSPSPQRPHMITPPLDPRRIRQEIYQNVRPVFDPSLRTDVLPRGQRRVITRPGGFQAVREDEPLIPHLPSPPREDPHIRRRKELERIQRKRRPLPPPVSPDEEVNRMIRESEREWELTPQHTPEGAALMDRTPPRRLRPPMATYQSPPVCAPCHVPAAEPGRLYPFTPPEQMGFYVPPASAPIHPDLVGVDLRRHMLTPQGDAGIMEETLDEYSPYFTPPQVLEDFESTIERERQEQERQAIEQWQPPRAVTFDYMPSPGELGLLTPPSCGIGPHREAYTPEESRSLGLLDESMLDSVAQGIISPALGGLLDPFLMDNVDEGWITTPPAGAGPTEQDIRDFLEPVPVLEHPASIQELRDNVERAAGRAGITPQPMYFGGYGETPRRYLPTRGIRQGAVRNLIQELDEVTSPPTSGSPPRAEEVDRSEIARIEAMRREAERQEMEFGQSYSPVMTSPQIVSPPRTPAGRPRTPARRTPTPAGRPPTPARRTPTPAGRPPTPTGRPPTPTGRPPTPTGRPPTPARRPPTPTRRPPTPARGPPTPTPEYGNACDTGTCNVAQPEPMQTYVAGEGWPAGLFSPQDSEIRRQEDAEAQRWIQESGYNPPAPQMPTTPQNISDNYLDFYETPPQLSPFQQLRHDATRAPNLLDEFLLDDYQSPPPMTPQNISDNVLESFESPPPLSPWEQMQTAAGRTQYLDDAYLEEFQSPPPLSQSPCSPRPGTHGHRAALEPQQEIGSPRACPHFSINASAGEQTSPRICAATGLPMPSGGSGSRQVQQRQQTPPQAQGREETPRRVVRKTSSVKKIQTKKK